MRGVSTRYEASGRTQQKQRTRDALVEAARRLIEGGDTPRVEDVAEASGISRTTAYRYFPTQTSLLAAAFPETATSSLLPDPAPEGLQERIAAIADEMISIIERTEVQQRAMLRLSLGEKAHELPLRQGRAIRWFAEGLEGSRLDDPQRLATAMRAVSGIETRVWLKDIAGLDNEGVRDMQTWMVQALLAHAQQAPPG